MMEQAASSSVVVHWATALLQRLDTYNAANRARIDGVYAQFSPTYEYDYVERLTISFPDRTDTAPGAGLRPEVRLRRTVPGDDPWTCQARGEPLPLAVLTQEVAALLRAVDSMRLAADPAVGHSVEALALPAQPWRLVPRQRDQSQFVQVWIMPSDVGRHDEAISLEVLCRECLVLAMAADPVEGQPA